MQVFDAGAVPVVRLGAKAASRQMLGRSARRNHRNDRRCVADARDSRRRTDGLRCNCRQRKPTKTILHPYCRCRRRLPSCCCGSPQQAQKAIARMNAAADANNGFTANVNAVTSYGMSGAACGARLRASAAGGCGPHGLKSRTTATANRSPGPAAIVPPRQPYFVILSEVDRRTQRAQKPLADYAEQGGERQTKCSQESVYVYFYTDSSSIFRSPQNDNAVFALNHFLSGTHSCARPGRLRGSRFQREPAPGARSSDQKEKEPAIIVILSVSEESMMNAASAETACGLCQARRRETNEMQSRIYSEQGYRCFAALNMTVAAALRKEVNDKRSAVKNLSTYTFIQILRRSAPQNDKLLNCSQTPPQTGISNWRQRE